MSQFKNWMASLREGNSLSLEEAADAAAWVASETEDAQQKVELLQALTEKGETSNEIAGFAKTFRERTLKPEGLVHHEQAIDVCGTGGDGSGTFNISTATSFLVASLEIPVFKHGNRSITSSCGSADILEALGWPLDPKSSERNRLLDRFHFTFFFAPSFHPAFKVVGPIRKTLAEKGMRTIFNLLGPLLNPGRPPYQLIGVMGSNKVDLVADALHQLDIKRGLVVHCELSAGKGLDEASTAGNNLGRGAGGLSKLDWNTVDPLFGLPPGDLQQLKGGEKEENLAILNELIRGKIRGALFDTVVLNAGLALWVGERASTPNEGIEMASRQLADGGVYSWLRNALA